MKEYIELFSTFAKIGTFTFGGGYAMLPLIQKEVVEKKKLGQRRRNHGLLCGRAMYSRNYRCKYCNLYWILPKMES